MTGLITCCTAVPRKPDPGGLWTKPSEMRTIIMAKKAPLVLAVLRWYYDTSIAERLLLKRGRGGCAPVCGRACPGQGRKQAVSRLRAFPRLNAEARRASAFVAKRPAQRFAAGVRHTSCTEMPGPDHGFPLLCSPPPLPPLLSPSRGPSRPGQWRPLRLAPSLNEPGTPVAFKLAK